MREKTGVIDIVVACDDHYMIMLAALLKSIECNHKTDELINIYIVKDKVSQSSIAKLERSVNKRMMHLHWIDITDTIPAGMDFPLVYNSYPLNTYVRLFIPYFLPPRVTKVLFMDVDMIVQEDISKLWHVDMGNNVIGAVTDSITKCVGNVEADGIANYNELGLAADTKFFNAGLQLLNTELWRRLDVTSKVIDCINENKKYAQMGDQYGLNVVVAGNYFELDTLWNYMANGDHPNPHLIHFIHRKPFYKSYFNNPAYQQIFYSYLEQTEWRTSKPIGERIRYVKKVNNLLQKINLLFNKRQRAAA